MGEERDKKRSKNERLVSSVATSDGELSVGFEGESERDEAEADSLPKRRKIFKRVLLIVRLGITISLG